MTIPNRWMRLRHPEGFSDTTFAAFRAAAEVLAAYVNAKIRVWGPLHSRPDESMPSYEFFPAELSADRRIMSLPIGGPSTLATRAAFENGCSYLLWQHLPMDVMEGLEEGLSEDVGSGMSENWRTPASAIGFLNADPEWRGRMLGKRRRTDSAS